MKGRNLCTDILCKMYLWDWDVLCESSSQVGLALVASFDISLSCSRRICIIWKSSEGPEDSFTSALAPPWPSHI